MYARNPNVRTRMEGFIYLLTGSTRLGTFLVWYRSSDSIYEKWELGKEL